MEWFGRDWFIIMGLIDSFHRFRAVTAALETKGAPIDNR
jgi:hypothetical protein